MSKPVPEQICKARGWYYIGHDKYFWRDCDHCHKEYKGMGRFYCSRSCKMKANPIIHKAGYIHPMHRPEIIEKVSQSLRGRKLTGEMYLTAIKGLEIGRTKIDLDYRKSQMPRGSQYHAWIQDRTKLKDDHRDRGGQLHHEWSRAIKNRDQWSCRIADVNCGGRLEAHHILSWKDFPELRYEVNNGITLCHFHHPRKVEEAKSLQERFSSLVAKTASK